jgi:hypothetical protein
LGGRRRTTNWNEISEVSLTLIITAYKVTWIVHLLKNHLKVTWYFMNLCCKYVQKNAISSKFIIFRNVATQIKPWIRRMAT